MIWVSKGNEKNHADIVITFPPLKNIRKKNRIIMIRFFFSYGIM